MTPVDLDALATPTHGAADHGHHVPRRLDGAEAIQWWPAQREPRERELRWTCPCRARVYRLVAGGGHAWIRRHDSGRVVETVRHHPHAAVLLWVKILAGQAA